MRGAVLVALGTLAVLGVAVLAERERTAYRERKLDALAFYGQMSIRPPDPVHSCGHRRSAHHKRDGACLHLVYTADGPVPCGCKGWNP